MREYILVFGLYTNAFTPSKHETQWIVETVEAMGSLSLLGHLIPFHASALN
jgi:hypothetical protein